MEEKLAFKEVLKEVGGVVKKFFRRCSVKDDVLKLPKKLKISGTKVAVMELGFNLIGITFAFFLTITNWAIEQKMALLGICLFMLYRGQKVADEAYRIFQVAESEKNMLVLKNEVSIRASSLIGKVSLKVLKKRKDGTFSVMENEEVINTIKNFLTNSWEGSVIHFFQYLEIGSVIGMLIVAVITNKSIPQVFFIPFLISFGMISFFSSAYLSVVGKKFYYKSREYKNKQDIILNDILRVPEIAIGRDTDMRISLLQTTITDDNEASMSYTRKRNVNQLFVTVLQTLGQYGIIFLYLFGIDWHTITLATIADMTANLVVVENALLYIGRIFRTISGYAEIVNKIDEEQSDMDRIMKVYYSEVSRLESAKKVTDIVIPKFAVSYSEKTENDKPFTLVAAETIEIKEGSIAILYGPSGSGKSTFMKMLTQRIVLEKSENIPSTSRFLFYDERLRFGSLSIFEEIFCLEEDPDFTKMQSILENLNLWAEIGRNCHNIWTWMKEKKFGDSLSNGQKQRLILAKMLYWLDDSIDVLVLDEATSGLDDSDTLDGSADASKILKYITRFANRDRKRTVIIATHQNVDSFIKVMTDDGYNFKILNFCKQGKLNVVTQNFSQMATY